MAREELGGLAGVAGLGLSAGEVRRALERHEKMTIPRLELLWDYYRNPLSASAEVVGAGGLIQRGLRPAMERGLPARVVGAFMTRPAAARIVDRADWSRKEVVIENDIAWRVNTMVDFMYGRPVRVSSTARTPKLRATIDAVLSAVLERSGGVSLMLDMGLLAHVFGSVDLLVSVDADAGRAAAAAGAARGDGERDGIGEAGAASTDEEGGPSMTGDPSAQPVDPGPSAPGPAAGTTLVDAGVLADRAAGVVSVRLLDPRRTVRIGSDDPRVARGYVVRLGPGTTGSESEAAPTAFLSRLTRRWWSVEGAGAGGGGAERDPGGGFDVYAGGRRQAYRPGARGRAELVEDGPSLGVERPGDTAPIVRVLNLPQPFEAEGLSEVEPLIGLQDELNTRLSDRASRVTMQSFRMYLVKGVADGASLPVAPGTVWSTDSRDASVTAFGGDAPAPGEERHIQEVREAMDKVSGVPPVAGGVVQARVGNLSSENALRITLIGLIGKTARKRISVGRGLAEVSRLVLDALDRLGILATDPEDRGVRVDWLDPLPRDEGEALSAAQKKIELGVDRARVLAELGYGSADPGVV